MFLWVTPEMLDELMSIEVLTTSVGVAGAWSSSDLLHGVGAAQLDGCAGVCRGVQLLCQCQLPVSFSMLESTRRYSTRCRITKQWDIFAAVVGLVYGESLILKSSCQWNVNRARHRKCFTIRTFFYLYFH
jgi:hypothetical protein